MLTTDRSVHEHASICRALNWMLSYDQLNLAALAQAASQKHLYSVIFSGAGLWKGCQSKKRCGSFWQNGLVMETTATRASGADLAPGGCGETEGF